jgi:hypothetical protein
MHVIIEKGMNVQVRLGLEAHEAGAYQRQVGYIRLLGELYAYRIVDSRTIFDTLYTLLSFGHETPESAAQMDPLSSFFRCEEHNSTHMWLQISCSST